METDELIPASAFCTSHQLEITFLLSLQQYGLIEIETTGEQPFIRVSQLPVIEKITRLHYELNINLEGIEAITYLLQRVESMQHEIAVLKNRLELYE